MKIAPEVIETLESWEELADAGRAVLSDMDTGRWLAGDLALRVEKKYGTDALGQYATDIGIASKSTLKDYRAVAARYEKDARAAFPALSWSHYRTALRAKDDAELFLVQAQDNGWPVAELARQIAAAIGKPVPPRLLWYGEATVLNAEVGWLYLGTEGDCGLGQGQKITVKVYAIEEAGNE